MASGCDVYVVDQIREGGVVKCGKAKRLGCQLLQDILMKSDKLKTSAKNNTVKDFEFSYFDDIDDALIEGLEQNQDFFSLLLSNDEIKKQVLGIFTEEIYKSLREA